MFPLIFCIAMDAVLDSWDGMCLDITKCCSVSPTIFALQISLYWSHSQPSKCLALSVPLTLTTMGLTVFILALVDITSFLTTRHSMYTQTEVSVWCSRSTMKYG